MSGSSWGKKLEKKLSGLADSASKESIQTLANWIGFNRKHASTIAETLAEALKAQAGNPTRQWLYWQVAHELLLLENSNPAKWDKLQDLRTAIGETTIVGVIESVSTLAPQLDDALIKQWDELNAFGGPTLVSQIRRLLTSPRDVASAESKKPVSEPAAAPAAASPPPKDQPAAEPATKPTPEEKKSTMGEPETDSAPAQRRTSLSSLKSVEYDFESKNVPAGKVDSRQFLEPCKAIATLQIARDLRNDAPVQLSSLLENLPEDIRNNLENEELSEETIKDYSKRIPDKLLDMDLDEQLNNIATFHDILTRQQKARKTLIHLLLKSRCQFGSSEAAKEFYELETMSEKLNKRKQLLTDALELEGMDNEIDNTDVSKPISKLSKLPWYETSEADDSNKKARIE